MKLRVFSTVGQNSTMSASDAVFAAKKNPQLIAQAIRVYLANQRQATSKSKTRGEINRTKKKWFKQKGTGNARHGARTPSIFVGGGVSHGPTGHENWSLKLAASQRKAALTATLSAQAEHIVVSDDLNQLDGKTASAQKLFTKMVPEAQHVLVILPKATPMVMRSLRNLERVYITSADRVNTYEVAYADAIVLTKESVQMLENRLARKAKQEVAVEEVKATPKKAIKAAPVKKTPAKPKKVTAKNKT